jgi:hypothetical protein
VGRVKRLPHHRAGSPLLVVSLDLPADFPADLCELARVATDRAPEALAGHRPDQAGLVVIHPDSPFAPDDQAGDGVRYGVEPMARMRELAGLLPLAAPLAPRPGVYVAILLGAQRVATLALSTIAREAS